MTLLIAIVALMLPLANAASPSFAVSFVVKNDPQAFMDDIARGCLSSPGSKITAGAQGRLDITERDGACAKEIQALAVEWDSDTPGRMFSVYARSARKQAVAGNVHMHFGSRVETAPAQSCPCVVLKGANAKDAAAFARRAP